MIMLNAAELFFLLVFWHVLADFAFQTDWLQRAKNHRDPAGLDRADFGAPVWPLALCAHSAIHAGGVGVISGSIALGVAEFAAHVLIDYLKSERRFGIYADQFLHLLCKGAWTVAAIWGASGGSGGFAG